MSATITAVKAFLKIPEGQRFVAGCIAVGYAVSYNKDVIELQKAIGIMSRENGTNMLQQQQRCDSANRAEVREARLEERERWRETTAESKRQMDEALRNSDRIYNKQQRLIRTVKQHENK